MYHYNLLRFKSLVCMMVGLSLIIMTDRNYPTKS